MNSNIVGIRFQKVGKVYHFDASHCEHLQIGDHVVVDTSRGRQIGEVVELVDNPVIPPDGTWKLIQRKATPRDLVLRQMWQKKELEAMIFCREKTAELKIEGIKIVGAEFSFDGERLSILFCSETEEKVDLKKLKTVVQRTYPKTHVELRQIGPRDVSKILGGMGACGLENRCCSLFLTEFSPISIKMAKEQGISLTPSEITGICGRLRCCLVYEYEQYIEARKHLPKRGKRVVTPNGEGKVVDVYPLKGTVVVELNEDIHREYPYQDVHLVDENQTIHNMVDNHDEKESDQSENIEEK